MRSAITGDCFSTAENTSELIAWNQSAFARASNVSTRLSSAVRRARYPSIRNSLIQSEKEWTG